ncbi:calmodulin-binding protein 25-like [Cynara cardunculus var. scolymus]|uniref:VQ-like protein n=1 Tax=Cynara cardunculus var. scolymus TaxID=59895 RepID=A0A103YLH1_CYNCS|nr:calmodulin-binding protein 25-like [Cynara cardunculus var. scolymus]KVI11274.1 VQ-like protein [Cynara cardunculus var. scolymus]
MASSDNLATIEPWMLRSTIGGDSWYSDAFSKETETALTKALQQSFFNRNQHPDIVSAANHPISSSFMVKQSDYCSTTASASTITASGSGSEPETPGSKRRGPNLCVSVGKTAKRKSRASKRSMTTFIQADPSNFRQMVQQVTGVKLEGNGHMPVSTVVKPEALRQPFINKLQGLLPTLDTSRYLLDHHHNNNTQRIAVSGTGFSRPPAMADGGIDFDSFSSFPTLESWN